MASKKLKKALIAGLGAAALSKMGQASQMKEYLASEGGSKSKISAITKKTNPTNFKDKVIGAAKKVYEKNINLGRGPGIKKTDTLAGMGGDSFGLGAYDGAKAGKMIKAKGGKEIVGKKTKLY
jgi:hypothetical protein